MTADAGLVPCAETGMMHTLRCSSPRDLWYCRMVMRPAYSPLAPLLGCSDTASKPVISASCAARSCAREQGSGVRVFTFGLTLPRQVLRQGPGLCCVVSIF